MKIEKHPKLNNVCFVDGSTKKEFLTRSTMSSNEKRTIDGVEYFVVSVQVTSDSHPFFTGDQKLFDTAGRIEKFESKFGMKKVTKKTPAKAESSKK